MINPIQALHYANPKILDSLVGFKVETFYHSDGGFITFWEKLPDGYIGKTKKLKEDNITRQCLEKIAELHKDEECI